MELHGGHRVSSPEREESQESHSHSLLPISLLQLFFQSLGCEFNSGNTTLGHLLERFDTVLDPKAGFIKEDAVSVEVHVVVRNLVHGQ